MISPVYKRVNDAGKLVFSRKDAPGAFLAGYKGNNKEYISAKELSSVRAVPTRGRFGREDTLSIAYKKGGKFMSKDFAEKILKSRQYQNSLKEKIKESEKNDPVQGDQLLSVSAFFEVSKGLDTNIDIFGFQRLRVVTKDPDGNTLKIETYNGENEAKEAARWIGYEAGKLAEKANKEKKGTPAQLFDVPLLMDKPGDFTIIKLF